MPIPRQEKSLSAEAVAAAARTVGIPAECRDDIAAELKHAAEISGAVVLLMAILGPVLTELALRRAGEPTRGDA